MEPSKKAQAILISLSLLLFLSFVVYRVSRNQRLNITNFASSNTIPLDSKVASQVTVLGVSETSKSGAKYKFRVETPSSFVFTPVSLTVSGSPLVSFQKTTTPYECIDMVAIDRKVSAFQTEFFAINSLSTPTGNVDIIFEDSNDALYKASYPIQFNCNILGSEYSQRIQISPEPDELIPEQ